MNIDSRELLQFVDGSMMFRLGELTAHLSAEDVRFVREHPTMRASTAATLLTEAEEIIYGDREQTHGEPSKNLRAIAGIWTSILQSLLKDDVRISEQLVCLMMAGLKLARASNKPSHREHALDTVGYMALMERCGYIDPPALTPTGDSIERT